MIEQLPDNEYLLLTPGPLSTSKQVRGAMLRDWCTWDIDYGNIVQLIRTKLVDLAGCNPSKYTSVLMQGSGTFSVESVLGTAIPPTGKVLILTNGAYGKRMVEIVSILNVKYREIDFTELLPINLQSVKEALTNDSEISHVAFVHCETTTGMLNPLEAVSKLAKQFGKLLIVDAMSSFGGIPINVEGLAIDYLISSANKCIQGVPGFGFVIARTEEIEKLYSNRRSLSLDLYNQWKTMEMQNGKWRFTSPTHTVRAFLQALIELEAEGGVYERYKRYRRNQLLLVEGMKKMGFMPLLQENLQSSIITTFLSPENTDYNFLKFYKALKSKGFVIYPGKVTKFNCFRIGNIGEVYEEDINRLIKAVGESVYWEEKVLEK